jgi:ubiquitin-activating enzyme E1
LSREQSLAFVSVETAGVFGRIFCDFGSSFEVYDADGEIPLVTPLDRVENFDGATMVVRCVEGEMHDVSKGDTIEFQRRNGFLLDARCVVTEVKSPFQFVVRLESDGEEEESDFIDQVKQDVASFRRVKIPQQLAFEPLDAAVEFAKTDDSLFTPCDLDKSFDSVRRSASFSCFQALPSFLEQHDKFPAEDDMDEFLRCAQESWSTDSGLDENAETHYVSFVRGCAAKFTPFQAMFGAIAAQEAIKAATGLYYPTRQFLLYDCDEVLAESQPAPKDEPSSDINPLFQAKGLCHIIGRATVEKLQAQRVFVVGAGAIGCEILKNLAAMDVGTAKKGSIILTDMDTIEKSNLSRQLLFRDADIGKFKSNAAHEAALRFNPSLRMEVHSSKVGDIGHGPFDHAFWSNRVDTVLNALDNVDARLHIDGECVSNEKALVDAGTMGPKGNVQVVVPHQSESYASSVDPPEQAIPVCTLKNFPYAISHTIQWARDLFDGYFEKRPAQANQFFGSLSSVNLDELAASLIHEQGDEMALRIAKELREDSAAAISSTKKDMKSIRSDALCWAIERANKLFNESVVQLLKQHPLDSADEDGEPFWCGTRRPPRMLAFSSADDPEQETINDNLVGFVLSAARLRLETLLLGATTTTDTRFTVDEAMAAVANHESLSGDANGNSNQPVAARVRSLLNVTAEHTDYPALSGIEFEKDDEANGHVAFVTAASNLRAIAYGIPPVDSMETRRVAGNIVPAMITTTGFVSALSCMELIKLVQKAPLRKHRNAFVNLALPFFAFTMPLPAEIIEGLRGRHYTLWDRLIVKEGKKAAASGGLTMRSLLRRIKKQASTEPALIEVASVSLGPYMLFANFLHDDDESVLNASIWEVISESVSSSEAFDEAYSRNEPVDQVGDSTVDSRSSVDLIVVVEDLESGEEFELPPVRVNRYKSLEQEGGS